MKTLTYIALLTAPLLLLAQPGNLPITSLTTTNRVTKTNWIAVVTNPGETNGTKKVSIENFAASLSPYVTNNGGSRILYRPEGGFLLFR